MIGSSKKNKANKKTNFIYEKENAMNEMTNCTMKNKVTNIVAKIKSFAITKRIAMLPYFIIAVLSSSSTAFASGSTPIPAGEGADLSGVTSPIIGLLNSFVTPLLSLVGAGGAIFCIFLGVKYATAEEPQEREKRKQALKTAIIGFVLIFVLIVVLRLSIDPLTNWMNNSTK